MAHRPPVQAWLGLSPPVLYKEMDLTNFMDIKPSYGPPNCLSCLHLNARSLKAFVPSNADPSVKVCRIAMLQDFYKLVSMILACSRLQDSRVRRDLESANMKSKREISSLFPFSRRPPFRVPFTFASSSLSESLQQATMI